MGEFDFTLNGQRHTLSREKVIAALRNQLPGRIQVHAVDVDGRYFPVKQALAQALQIPKSEFISTRAVELLKKAGLRVIDTDIDRPIQPMVGEFRESPDPSIRLAALELAVAHLSSSNQPADASAVLSLAAEFGAWLIRPLGSHRDG
jgi:hypothetical protein